MLKTAFLLLLVAFGVVMFVAGALAPAYVKAPLERVAARAAAWLPAERPRAASEALKPPAAGLVASGVVASGAASGATSGAVYAASTPMAALLVPAVPPAKARYALQGASFASSDAASLFASSVAARGYKATLVPISDADQPFVVAIGDYPSPEAASADQLIVARDLKIATLLPVVMLPPPAH
jgi:SPOR domain